MTNKEAIRRIKEHSEIHFKLEYPNAIKITEALNMAIKALEQQEKERWIPVSERLPEEDGDYICTIEWYGTSTKELLIKNGYEIGRRLKSVHFLNSNKSFKECDEFCTYKVLAWKNQGLYKGE